MQTLGTASSRLLATIGFRFTTAHIWRHFVCRACEVISLIRRTTVHLSASVRQTDELNVAYLYWRLRRSWRAVSRSQVHTHALFYWHGNFRSNLLEDTSIFLQPTQVPSSNILVTRIWAITEYTSTHTGVRIWSKTH